MGRSTREHPGGPWTSLALVTCALLVAPLSGGVFVSSNAAPVETAPECERAWFEVDTDVLVRTTEDMAARVKPSKFCAVLKGDGFGIGNLLAGRALDESPGVDMFCVDYLETALELRRGGIKKPILVMYYAYYSAGTFCEAARANVTLSLGSPSDLRLLMGELGGGAGAECDSEGRWNCGKEGELPSVVDIHLVLDMSMNREGFVPGSPSWVPSLQSLKETAERFPDRVKISGVWTHFGCSNMTRVLEVADRFDVALQDLITTVGLSRHDLTVHTANSRFLGMERLGYDMVRTGANIKIPWPFDGQSLNGRVVRVSESALLNDSSAERGIDGYGYGYGCDFAEGRRRALEGTTVVTVAVGWFDLMAEHWGQAIHVNPRTGRCVELELVDRNMNVAVFVVPKAEKEKGLLEGDGGVDIRPHDSVSVEVKFFPISNESRQSYRLNEEFFGQTRIDTPVYRGQLSKGIPRVPRGLCGERRMTSASCLRILNKQVEAREQMERLSESL
uniref:Alanine racemase N-terminal domain-containing protein n=1 Tax=Chromera velia CCMP2878 TaxID=1169474 RepID=A0A0G4GTJ4_9ALVE|eukprot:Cvel_23332.t1-p1 / transcript=Cvel_23332.t1 / gene=Cvel_23332 / organism=Chromera_velia_CCMP2878 / gene_product=Alanine racemase, putative / transcript_product=Alanine racemase, putative / location=Cvel_scaffold2391:3659-7932(+) / protein_length=503 / sequence_SO=supercontig / SO=protein_coding / is_pseudo=false